MKRWTDTETARLIQLSQMGFGLKRIGMELGRGPEVVRQRLVRLGIDRQPRNHFHMSEVEVEQVRNLYRWGHSVRAIAQEMGYGKETVRQALLRLGVTLRPRERPGALNPFWKGGSWVDRQGYVLVHVPKHPFATSTGYVRAHRLVMEQHLGRYLTPTEVVHHLDGNRQNNGLSNLRLFPRNSDHLRYELKGQVPRWTPSGYQRMLDSALRKRKPRIPGPGRGRPGQPRGPSPQLSAVAIARPRDEKGRFLPQIPEADAGP